jgi:hypothetical protein
LARSAAKSLFIISSACCATVLLFRRSVQGVGWAASNVSRTLWVMLRRTWMYTLRRYSSSRARVGPARR